MKSNEMFFNGVVSDYFRGYPNLYVGDIDFRFANDHYVINAEIKTISQCGSFTGKKMSALQAREYAATAGMIDALGRRHKNYLFEYHKYAKRQYVIVTPFKLARGNESEAIHYLNTDASRMMYVDDEMQFLKLFQGFELSTLGVSPRKSLQCVNPF